MPRNNKQKDYTFAFGMLLIFLLFSFMYIMCYDMVLKPTDIGYDKEFAQEQINLLTLFKVIMILSGLSMLISIVYNDIKERG